MKNLKKVGAVALAAVMAVTFAPVASLNVFAAENAQVNSDNEITATAAEIGKKGTYKIKDGLADGPLTIQVIGDSDTAEKTVTIDVNGHQAQITLLDAETHVIIKNSKSLKRGDIPKVTVTATTYKTLTLEGNYELDTTDWDTAKVLGNVTKEKGLAVGSTPVAEINGKRYVGQDAITRAEADAAPADASVVALNGAVKVVNLPDGATASVSDTAQAGTTITATAEDGLTLQTYVTTYTFKYAAKTAAGPGQKTLSSGTKTYVDTRYAVGTHAYTAVNTAPTVEADAEADFKILGKDVRNLTHVGVGVRDIYNATIANGLDVLDMGVDVDGVYSAETAITYTKGKDWKEDDNPIAALDGYNATTGNRPNTYYTQDPTGQVTGAVIALVDGKKYSVTAVNMAATTLSVCPADSVEILRSDVWTKDGGNKDASFKFNFISGEGVSVKAASDMSAAQVYVKTIAGTDVKYYYGNAVWGKDATIPAADTAAATATSAEFVYANVKPNEIKDNAAEGRLVVWQVADGEDKTVKFQNIKGALPVDRADGIGYYREANAGTPANYDYTFGKTAVVTKDFENKAQGYTKNGVAIDPEWKSGLVYASKEIQTTIKVPTSTVFVGETSQSVSTTDAKTKIWVINGGVNTPQNVYRLRAKVGNNHLFTMDTTEANNAVASGNWVLESAEAFKMLPSNTTRADAVKVLRFRNVKTNEFLFSTDPAEQAAKLADPEWAEGYVAFCGVKDNTTGYPVTRLFSTIGQGHLYSTAQAEVKSAVEKDHYVKDGVVFFALETPEKEK